MNDIEEFSRKKKEKRNCRYRTQQQQLNQMFSIAGLK